MNEQQPATNRGRLRRYAEIATVIAAGLTAVSVVVAILAWRWPVSPFAAGPASTSPPGIEATPSAAGTPRSTGTVRYLTDMSPVAGESNTQADAQTRSFVLECPSGATNDQYREVQYRLRGAYRQLSFDFEAKAEEPELLTQLEVFADNVELQNVILTGSDEEPMAADVTGRDVLSLRLRCQRSTTVVTIGAAKVIG